MPRNKTSKRQKTSNSLANIQNFKKMEKALTTIPTKLIAQLHKEIKNHKKKETKLRNAINKVRVQLEKSEQRLKTAEQKSNSTVGKKQFKKIKKSHDGVLKSHFLISNDLQKTSHSLVSLEAQHEKLVALHKHINQFEKEWAKNAKKIKDDDRAPLKAEEKIKIKTTTLSPQPPMDKTPVIENVRLEEATEIAS